jgi:hypothetical protein
MVTPPSLYDVAHIKGNPFACELTRELNHQFDIETIDIDALTTLNQIARTTQCLVSFTTASTTDTAVAYESQIITQREVPTRMNHHDLLNALMWVTYPNAKWAISQQHLAVVQTRGDIEKKQRSPRRDALTVFDESGMVVLSSKPELLQMIRDFKWHELFVRHRDFLIKNARLLIFGHGLYEALHTPHIGLTGKAILIDTSQILIDAAWSEQIQFADQYLVGILSDTTLLPNARALSPLPLLGWPGWFAGNEEAAFYSNTQYFRSGRIKR